MGWAAGFQAGSRVAGEALDAYYQSQQRGEIEAIQNAKPTDVEGYSPQQAEAMERTSQLRDADGNYQYQVTPAADGRGYGLAVRNAEGGYGPVQGAGWQMGRTTDFMGKRFADGELSDAKAQGLRARAMAGVVSKSDPVKGAAMLSQLNQEERTEKLFNDQQTDRATAKELEANRRSYYQSLKAMKPEDLANSVGEGFSRDGSGVDAMLTYDDKSGKFMFASKVPGMGSRLLSRAELENYAMGVWEQGNGDFGRGMQMVMDTIKTQRDLSEKDRAEATNIAGLNFQADKANRDNLVQNRRLDIEDAYKTGMLQYYKGKLGIEADAEKRAANASRMGAPVQMWDPVAKQAVLVQPVMDGSGKVSYMRPDTGGLQLPKAMPSMDDVLKLAKQYEGMTEQVNNKRVPISPEKAFRLARAELWGQSGEGAGALPAVAPPPDAAPTPAPTRNNSTPSSANPYVDTKGNRTGLRVPGDDVSILGEAVRGLPGVLGRMNQGMNEAYYNSIAAKMQRGEPLTAVELRRAQDAGMIVQ